MFSTKSNLLNHQKKAKYCLLLQKEDNINDEINFNDDENYKCEYCERNFSTKRVLENHKNICINYYSFLVTEQINNNKLITLEKEIIERNLLEKEKENLKLQAENDLLWKQMENLLSNNSTKECLLELQDKLQEIAMVAIDQKNETITGMVKNM